MNKNTRVYKFAVFRVYYQSRKVKNLKILLYITYNIQN